MNNIRGRELRRIRQVFGESFKCQALPVVSAPLGSLAEAQAQYSQIGGVDLEDEDQAVLVQPEEAAIPKMSEAAALGLVRRDDAWARFLDVWAISESSVVLRAVEHGRCWAILAVVPGAQLPPGEAFVVDKYSKRVFSRRYIDVMWDEDLE